MRWALAIVFGLVVGSGVWWVVENNDTFDGPAPTVAAPATTTSTTTPPPPACQPAPASSGFHPATIEGVTELIRGLGCADHVTIAPAADNLALRTALAVAAEQGGPILLAGTPGLGQILSDLGPRAVTVVAGAELPGAAVTPVRQNPPVSRDIEGSDGLILIDHTAPAEVITLARVYAAVVGAASLTIDTTDLRALDPATQARISAVAGPIQVISVGPAEEWQLAVVQKGLEIPGGGQLMFPGRRMVALYGSPGFPSLGVLGEQGPLESVERIRQVAQGYEADGTAIMPGFEIIATVASAGATDDGDYSYELSTDEIRPWIEAAGDGGLYVLLDLQPGRTDFLTQAKRYEEFLVLPHVGLALDPEWRLKPNQVHLRQIGTVDSAEINLVSEWLAGIVRREALPQKLFMVHQFNLSMISNREQIAIPPELAVVIQMDGQGPLGSKYGTWEALKSAGPNPGWWWGWKNFYDEDSPTATPAQVLELEPVPVVVTYQ
jgi:hypothetical protein